MTTDQYIIESLRAECNALAQECERLKQERRDVDLPLIESMLTFKASSSKLNADIESLRTEVAQLKQRRFPIQDGPSVPWSLLVPYEGQAFTNHDQSLERLAQRGGLGVVELWCVVHGKRWHEAPSKSVADTWLRLWLHEQESTAAERDALQLKLEAERELAVQLVKNELTLRRQAEVERDAVRLQLAKACTIADEWIDLGIPDDDAIQAKGAIADIRKTAGITTVEEKS